MSYVCDNTGCILSDEDADIAETWVFCVNNVGYITSGGGFVHRIVMERVLSKALPDAMVVDHINENKKDNRRENLRMLSDTDNKLRSFKKRGEFRRVQEDRPNRYTARLSYKGETFFLGVFSSAEEAAFCADSWAVRLLSEHAQLNFPERLTELLEAAKKIDTLYPWGRTDVGA